MALRCAHLPASRFVVLLCRSSSICVGVSKVHCVSLTPQTTRVSALLVDWNARIRCLKVSYLVGWYGKYIENISRYIVYIFTLLLSNGFMIFDIETKGSSFLINS